MAAAARRRRHCSSQERGAAAARSRAMGRTLSAPRSCSRSLGRCRALIRSNAGNSRWNTTQGKKNAMRVRSNAGSSNANVARRVRTRFHRRERSLSFSPDDDGERDDDATAASRRRRERLGRRDGCVAALPRDTRTTRRLLLRQMSPMEPDRVSSILSYSAL